MRPQRRDWKRSDALEQDALASQPYGTRQRKGHDRLRDATLEMFQRFEQQHNLPAGMGQMFLLDKGMSW